ncbi:MAG: hypothetical protein GY797_30905 [Deltaproteobacteria bacterium]|nr:hypothetical protein [Deltaproteobacteria bacterium]
MNKELFPDAFKGRFHKSAKNSPYQIHIMGYSHVPYNKIVDRVHYIDPDSSGQMFDESPQTSFVILKVYSERKGVEPFHISYPLKEVVKGLQITPAGYLFKIVSNGKNINQLELS